MKQKSTSMIAVLLVVFLGLLTGMNGQLLGQGGTVVSKFGQAQVEGRDVIVHVTVVVPPGANANQVALDALRNQGARPFQGDEFSTSGLVWDQFITVTEEDDPTVPTVKQYYNETGDPTSGDGERALLHAQWTWGDVGSSKFAFEDGGITDRCPSLVKECKGPQTFDTFNDVGWLRIGGCCTLAVTWFSTSVDEADMALNTNFSWSPGSGGFDAETVMLHENGHVAGLGHSIYTTAVMFATYQGKHRWLGADDIDGIYFLYPADGTTGSISGTVTSSSDDSPYIYGATVEIKTKSLWTTTDTNGYYSIDRVPAGTTSYEVTASASGFFDDTVWASTDTSGVNFALDPDGTSEGNTPALAITEDSVDSDKSGKGGSFKITWETNNLADSEVSFDCCGTFTNSELVTDHSMSFRGKKGEIYTYEVRSTNADRTVTSGGHTHFN